MSVPLPSRLATGHLAQMSVGAFASAAGIRSPLDPERIALAYRSDRLLAIDGSAPDVWSPLSRFWRTSDGWIRTHGNYPHHADRLMSALGLGTDTVHAEAVIAEYRSSEAVALVAAAGGMAVEVRPEDPARDQALRQHPLVEVTRSLFSPQGPVSLEGVRVLDLTRVIAGPVCTRSLALLGADVLRIDPPELSEPEWQHFDTGHGKRSAVLDARSPAFRELLAEADVLVLGYRPAALARLDLDPDILTEQHPGLIVAQLSAWGLDDPERGGFDSLVQAESGIALIESPDGDRPGALPAQALDHSAGYLLAASVIGLLNSRKADGVGGTARTSLRRIAAELLGMPRSSAPGAEREIDPHSHTATFEIEGRTVTTVRPAVPGYEFPPPHRWASDQPRW